MNWEKQSENYYIIGLDIGNDSSGMAFYNLTQNMPETIDLSGGYGKSSIPTVMQYIAETKEWVFGEYAMLNRGAGTEITLSAMVERLGNFDYIDVDRRSLSVASVLGLFIKELLGNVRSINPNAEVVGIVASVPAYFSEQACEEFTHAFKLAGYEKELIALVPDRECVLAHYYSTSPHSNEHALILDFGARELRGGLYQISNQSPKDGVMTATSVSSLFSDIIGTTKINNDISDFFAGFVFSELGKDRPPSSEQRLQIEEHISAFSYQHKDMLFQKNIRAKPVKLYFNFMYPPFQQTVSSEQVQALMRPYAAQFSNFIKNVFKKNIANKSLAPNDVDTVLCVGGGFEMLWAREAVAAMFSRAQVHFYKTPKMVTSEGAAIVAARMLGVHGAGDSLTLEDAHQLTYDIGLTDGHNFLPLVERNAFWWQNHVSKLILVNQPVTGELSLDLCARSNAGEMQGIVSITLSDLPHRPKGTTRLEVGISFASNKDAIITVCDKGFGALFPPTEYERRVEVRL